MYVYAYFVNAVVELFTFNSKKINIVINYKYYIVIYLQLID